MDENEKMEKAVFRYSVISDLVNVKNLNRGEQERLIIEKCAHKWAIPFSEKTSIGRSSILRWINLYKNSGCDLKSLYRVGKEEEQNVPRHLC